LREASEANSAAPEPGQNDLDWQAQKAKLLAMLDDEAGTDEIAAERQSERATVQGTITITDEVVAEKDRLIEELQSALDEQQASAESNEQQQCEEQREALLDGDDLIQQERQRLEELQSQWQDKLRAAELEISVERAKLAREQAALQEQMSTVAVTEEEKTSDGRPKRRWLAALGLGDDEDDG
ncbi:MAG: hypothetical protein AAF961_19460, partial [Planctomycetota bacterium]